MYPGIHSQTFPQKAAAVNAYTNESATYEQLDKRSNQLAHYWRAQGLKPNDHVAIFMENHLRYFEICWAAFRSGLYITTINRYLTAEEAGYIANDCHAKSIISSKKLTAVAVDLPELTPMCKDFLMVDGVDTGFESYEDAIKHYPETSLDEEPAGQFMMYSSGTTGHPKGILHPPLKHSISAQPSGVARCLKALWGGDQQTIYLSTAPLYHTAPIHFCLAIQELGGTVIMLPSFDEVQALKAMEEYRVTHSQWVPTMFIRMLKMPEQERNQYNLAHHKVAIHGSAPCPVSAKEQMLNWWGDILFELYGSTESIGLAHCTSTEWRQNPGTVGKLLMGSLHICDEAGNELGPHQTGMVYIENPQASFSYYGDQEKTQKVQHPQHSSWVTLGDIGYLNQEGYLFLTDRANFMIISGGVNIYPQEIENALIMHEKIADIAVIGVPHSEMGEEVKAIIQPKNNVTPTPKLAEEIVNYARSNLAHYKCPRTVEFVDQLPRLPTGKLYKRALKERYWQQA